MTDPQPIPDARLARELAQRLGVSETAAAAWLGAVAVEQNPPPGLIVTV